MKVLYELVTVIKECMTRQTMRSLALSWEDGLACLTYKPGNLPFIGTGTEVPNHE